MKRKHILLGVALLAGFVSMARQLDSNDALDRAISACPTKISALKNNATVPKLMKTMVSDEGNTAIYVFNTPEHTIFVSAQDNAPALLGYTDNPIVNFDNMPVNIQNWLYDYTKHIDHNIKINAPAYNGRAKAASTSGDFSQVSYYNAIEPLIQTNWDQMDPYNMYCPTLNGVPTYTGCVATTMAQVMNYHKYPERCNFYADYYWPANRDYIREGVSYTFDWDNMPKNASCNDTQKKAVAELMRACGLSLNMNYNYADGSETWSYLMPDALRDKFGYDASVRRVMRWDYSYDDWVWLCYQNLRDIGPICYSGAGDIVGGHEFVMDGYKDGLFHFNWGWSGFADGYFHISALNPITEGDDYGYNTWQDAIIGIRPLADGKWEPDPTPYPGPVDPDPQPKEEAIYANPSTLSLSCDKGQTASGYITVSTENISGNITIWADDAEHVSFSPSSLVASGGTVYVTYSNTQTTGMHYTSIHFRGGSKQVDVALECNVKDEQPVYGSLTMGIKGHMYAYKEGTNLVLKTGSQGWANGYGFGNLSDKTETVTIFLQARNFDTGEITYIPETSHIFESLGAYAGYDYLSFNISWLAKGKYLVSPAYTADSHYDFRTMERRIEYGEGNAIPITITDDNYLCGIDRMVCSSKLVFEERGMYNSDNLTAKINESGYAFLYLNVTDPEDDVELYFEGADADQFSLNRPFGGKESGFLTIIHSPTREGEHTATLMAHSPWTRAEFALAAQTEKRSATDTVISGAISVSVNAGIIEVNGIDCDNIAIFNLSGAKILEAINAGHMDCRHLPHGVYILHIHDTQGTIHTHKIIL